jgi:hypothetical protein
MEKLITVYSTFEVSVEAPAAAAGEVCAALYPNQTAAPDGKSTIMGLTRLSVTLKTAVESYLSLQAVDTAGVTPTELPGFIVSSGNGGFGEDRIGQLAAVWAGAKPVPNGVPYRKDLIPNVIGAGFEWTWPDDDPFTTNLKCSQAFFGPLPLPAPELGLCIVNVGALACATLVISARWSQFRFDPVV